MSRVVLSWFCKFLTYGGEVIEYWKKNNNQKQIIRVFGHTLRIVGKHSLIKI